MSITLTSLHERIARELSGYIYISSMSSSTDTGIIISTQLTDKSNNSLQDKFLKILSATATDNTYLVRKIESNQRIPGTVKVYRPLNAVIGATTTAGIYDVDPEVMTFWINDTVRLMFPSLKNPVENTQLITHNILVNSDFEDWSSASACDGWTASTATLSRSTTKYFGSYSASLTTAAGYVYQSSDSYPDLLRLAGTNASLYCWVKTTAASNARIAIYTLTKAGTATVTYSDYHTGANEWELLEINTADIPDLHNPSETTDLAEVQVRLVTATTDTAYFDRMYMPFTTYEYLLPDGITEISEVWECDDWWKTGIVNKTRLDFNIVNKSGTEYLRLNPSSQGKTIVLYGSKGFTSLSADTDSLTIPEDAEKTVVYGSVAGILTSLANTLSGKDRDVMINRANEYRRLFNESRIKKAHIITTKRRNKSV